MGKRFATSTSVDESFLIKDKTRKEKEAFDGCGSYGQFV
jgi:hypothetical protein